MPALQNSGGDVLARGGIRAQFRPAGSHKTQEQWDAMFEGSSTAEEFVNKETETVTGPREETTTGLPRR